MLLDLSENRFQRLHGSLSDGLGVGLEIDPVADPGRLPADRLPYRLIFVACRNVEGLAELEPRMRESAQLVVVVPDDTDLEAEVAFLSVENCHHVVKLGGSGGSSSSISAPNWNLPGPQGLNVQ